MMMPMMALELAANLLIEGGLGITTGGDLLLS